MFKIKIILLVAVAAAVSWYVYHHHGASVKQAVQQATVTAKTEAAKTVAQELASHCIGKQLANEVIVSVGARHMWACAGSKAVYDAPVITGMEMYAADLTPAGSYKIYAKLADQALKGCDSTGCWNDPVSYWMPFLNNQYGVYGFHDAAWRLSNDFGNISPNSNKASHGCVELPLAAAKWLYGWAPIGTTVTVEN